MVQKFRRDPLSGCRPWLRAVEIVPTDDCRVDAQDRETGEISSAVLRRAVTTHCLALGSGIVWGQTASPTRGGTYETRF